MGSAVTAIHAHNLPIPMSSTTGGGSSGADGSTISANDFLTLLVTEMKNQDPTANTDPNEYINQLVQVNSLEQLIQINQNLTTALGGTNTGSDGSASGQVVSAADTPAGHVVTAAAKGDSRSSTFASVADGFLSAPGNLGMPQPNLAAERVAQALSSR